MATNSVYVGDAPSAPPASIQPGAVQQTGSFQSYSLYPPQSDFSGYGAVPPVAAGQFAGQQVVMVKKRSTATNTACLSTKIGGFGCGFLCVSIAFFLLVLGFYFVATVSSTSYYNGAGFTPYFYNDELYLSWGFTTEAFGSFDSAYQTYTYVSYPSPYYDDSEIVMACLSVTGYSSNTNQTFGGRFVRAYMSTGSPPSDTRFYADQYADPNYQITNNEVELPLCDSPYAGDASSVGSVGVTICNDSPLFIQVQSTDNLPYASYVDYEIEILFQECDYQTQDCSCMEYGDSYEGGTTWWFLLIVLFVFLGGIAACCCGAICCCTGLTTVVVDITQ